MPQNYTENIINKKPNGSFKMMEKTKKALESTALNRRH